MLDVRKALTLIAQVEMISHGSTRAFDSSGGHSSEKPLLPAGEPNPPHIALRAQLAAALTQSQVDRVTHNARAALKAAKYTPALQGTEPEYGTIHWKRWIANSSESNTELARRFHVSAQYIGQIRKQWGSAAA